MLRALVGAHADEAREAQRDAFGLVDAADAGLVHRRDGEVGALDLPHGAGLKPDVGDVLLLVTVLEVALGLGDLLRLELLRKLFELLVGETRP